jgi:YcxB-like protein
MPASADALTFTFEWNFREHARLSSFLTREYFTRRPWRIAGAVALVLVLGSVLLEMAASKAGPTAALIGLTPWLVFLVLWLGFFLYGVGWVSAWQVRRQDPSIREPFTYALTDRGLHVKAHNVDVEVQWPGIYKVRERPDAFLFYYNVRCAYQLPKRAIGPSDQLRAVRDFIRAHLPSSTPFLGSAPAV